MTPDEIEDEKLDTPANARDRYQARQRESLSPSVAVPCSVVVLLKPREIAALDGLCTQKDMTRQGVMLAALRLYQAVALEAAAVTWKYAGLSVGCMGDDCPPNVGALPPGISETGELTTKNDQ